MMQLYSLVEQVIVNYLSGCSGNAVCDYKELTKENEKRRSKADESGPFVGPRYEIDFSNDGMHKSGVSIDELYMLIINRTLPVFESFKEDLTLAIIQLRYEVSVMFKNLSFGSNNKEDIKQIFEYNESKQANDSNSNSPIYITSF